MNLGSECGVQNRVDQGFYVKNGRVSVASKSTKPETGETDDLADTEDRSLVPSTYVGQLRTHVTPAPGCKTLSSDLFGYYTHIHIYKHIQRIKLTQNFFLLL